MSPQRWQPSWRPALNAQPLRLAQPPSASETAALALNENPVAALVDQLARRHCKAAAHRKQTRPSSAPAKPQPPTAARPQWRSHCRGAPSRCADLSTGFCGTVRPDVRNGTSSASNVRNNSTPKGGSLGRKVFVGGVNVNSFRTRGSHEFGGQQNACDDLTLFPSFFESDSIDHVSTMRRTSSGEGSPTSRAASPCSPTSRATMDRAAELHRRAVMEEATGEKHDDDEVEDDEEEDAAIAERNTFESSLECMFAKSSRGTTAAAEELFIRALRRDDIAKRLRLASALELARLLAKQDSCPAREGKLLELQSILNGERQLFLEDPGLTIMLVEVCEAPELGLVDFAETACVELEQQAMRLPANELNPHRYVLLDLAERRKRQGQQALGKRLWDHARVVPAQARDPRLFPRHYRWRFDDTPGIASDAFKVAGPDSLADHQLAITRPWGGAQRHCVCARYAALPLGHVQCEAELMKSSSMPLIQPPTIEADSQELEPASRPRCRTDFVPRPEARHTDACNFEALQRPRATTAWTTQLAEPVAPKFQAFPGVPLQSFTKEFESRFGLAASFVDLGQKIEAEPMEDEEFEMDGHPARRVLVAESAARRFVRARRFQVCIVDSSITDKSSRARNQTAPVDDKVEKRVSLESSKRALRRAKTSPPLLSCIAAMDDEGSVSLGGAESPNAAG